MRNMNQLVSVVILAGAIAAPSIAHAGGGSAGVAFELLPQGSYEISTPIPIVGGTATTSGSMDTAYAIAVVGESQVNDLVSIGFAPRYIFNVIGKNDSGDAGSELDLRARVALGHDLGRKLRVYGFAEPGWSILFSSRYQTNNNNDHYHPNGFVLAFGGGLGFAFTSTVRGTFELGYQAGFQTWSYDAGALGTYHGDGNVSYLSLGFGIASSFE